MEQSARRSPSVLGLWQPPPPLAQRFRSLDGVVACGDEQMAQSEVPSLSDLGKGAMTCLSASSTLASWLIGLITLADPAATSCGFASCVPRELERFRSGPSACSSAQQSPAHTGPANRITDRRYQVAAWHCASTTAFSCPPCCAAFACSCSAGRIEDRRFRMLFGGARSPGDARNVGSCALSQHLKRQ